jgi:hypothetical protein
MCCLERALLSQRDMLFDLADFSMSNPLETIDDQENARRLRRDDARSARSDVADRMVVVLAPRDGVTVVRASVPESAAEYAIARGLAKWECEGNSLRLRLTAAGRAHARRLSAPSAEAFRAQHLPLAKRLLERETIPVLCNEGESPLVWLARRKDRDGRPFLDSSHLEAGERFRRDITQAQILQRVTVNWEAPVASSPRTGGGAARVPEIAIDARKRLSRAFDAVGPDLARLLTDVCGYLKRLEIVESERGWPPRSAKVVLKIALERLAIHYGLASEARGPAGAHCLLHWGAKDYRPRISTEAGDV